MESHLYKKRILDRFQQHLQQEYEAYCQRHGLQKTDNQDLLTFLIDRNLIPATHIQRYTVLQEFPSVFQEQECHKTHAVHTLAHRFSLSERTVWSILKQLGRVKKKT